jgi:DNA-binding NtrC family response regulator
MECVEASVAAAGAEGFTISFSQQPFAVLRFLMCMGSNLKVVVIAEDESLIRMYAADVLIAAGFEVIEATDAAEALAALEARNATISVLFTDIHMPGPIDGLTLAHHARRKWPGIGLLVTSGKGRPDRSALPPKCRFLAKPYDLSHVVKHVRELAAV